MIKLRCALLNSWKDTSLNVQLLGSQKKESLKRPAKQKVTKINHEYSFDITKLTKYLISYLV